MIRNKSVLGINYIKMDMYRAMICWKFIISIFGVSITMFVGAIFTGVKFSPNVLQIFYLTTSQMVFILSMIFGGVYSGCFCEDYENKYFRIELIRGNLKFYTFSKLFVNFLITVISVMSGILIFVYIIHFFMPWINSEDSFYLVSSSAGYFRKALKAEHFIIYYTLLSLKLGIMIGILSVASSYVSLYVTNKLLTLSMPVIIYYFTNYLLEIIFGQKKYTFDILFSTNKSILENDILSFAIIIGLSMIIILIFYGLIYKKIERALRNE